MTTWLLTCSLTLAGDLPAPEASPVAPAETQTELMVPAEERMLQLRLLAAEARIAALEKELALQAAQDEADEAIGRRAGVVVTEREVVPKAVAFGGPVCVKGRVLNDAVSFGDDVRVEPGARVEGNAVSFGGRVIVEPGGSVKGDRVSYAGTSVAENFLRASAWDSAGDSLRRLARQLVLLLSFAGAGVLMVGAFPGQVDRVEAQLVSSPVSAGLLGLAVTGAAALLSTVLVLTIVGIPLAMALIGALIASWLVGFVAFCKACGDRLPVDDVRTRRWVAFLAGVLAVACVGALPWVGRITLVIVGFACVGASVGTRFGTRVSE